MNKQETTKEKLTVPVARATKVRTKVLCSCKKCDGKMVDPRTRQKHKLEENRLQASISNMKEDREKESNQHQSIFLIPDLFQLILNLWLLVILRIFVKM